MNKQKIRQLFYLDKDYQRVCSCCQEEQQDSFALKMLAKSLLELGKIDDAYLFYRKMNMDYEAGYCQLLKGFSFLAEKIWASSDVEAFDISWGLSLVSIINENKIKYPNFFQIRSFLEQDINNFFKFGQREYIDKLINVSRIFAQINPETFKFFGRVLLYNGDLETALQFLNLSKDFCFKDPETHFLIGTYYLQKKEFQNAKKSFKMSVEVANGYFPSEKILLTLR